MSLMAEPSATGRFGEFGGRFVPETLVPACEELEEAFREAWADTAFRAELDYQLRQYAGRPSILTDCANLSDQLGIRLVLKREDLNHTGSHKINNVLGQALLAKRMGKSRLVAETGAGQHGVASATAAALLGMECKVYMGAVDVERSGPRALIDLTRGSSATVDLAGEFRFDGLPAGRYTLTVRAPGDPLRKARCEVDAVRGTTRAVLTLRHEATGALVAGRVVDRTTGRPLQHFIVDVVPATRGGWTLRAFEELALDGRFREPLAWTPGETYRVEVTAPGYTAWRSATLQLDTGEASASLVDLAVELDPAAPLTLRIVAAAGSVAPDGLLALQFARVDGEPVLASATGYAPGFVATRVGEPKLVQGLPSTPLRMTLDSSIVEGTWRRWTADFDPARAVDGALTVAVDFQQGEQMSR